MPQLRLGQAPPQRTNQAPQGKTPQAVRFAPISIMWYTNSDNKGGTPILLGGPHYAL
ncbi:hypothetical protein AGMMS49992_17990 [Clostridia bacterium]|nr:hypothetical protein AGMMS49992_17990 [Clostridia bacterium]